MDEFAHEDKHSGLEIPHVFVKFEINHAKKGIHAADVMLKKDGRESNQ